MTISAAQLLVTVGANTLPARSQLMGLAGMLGSGGMLAAGATAAGAVMVGVGVLATKMAGDFQAELTSLVTGAGESQKNLQMVHDGILQLAKDTGTSTKQLVDGMYMIESGGFHGASGLNILKAAAEGAKVGNADLGVVADATDTILKNFGEHGALTADQAVNALISTVAHGKTHMEDLASSLAFVLPTAQAAGLSLLDTTAAMATMTSIGVPAAESATYLRQTIVALMAPSDGAKKALASIGLTSKEVADRMTGPDGSLYDGLKLITDHLKTKFPEGSAGYIAAVREIAGGSRQMQGILDLTGSHLGTLRQNMLTIGADTYAVRDGIKGWALVQQNANQQLARAKEAVSTYLIQLGEKLLPIVTAVAKFFADNLPSAIKTFQTAIAPVAAKVGEFLGTLTKNKPLMDGLKESFERLKPAIGPILTGLAILTAISFAPLALAIAAILGLVFVLTHLKEIIGTVAGAIGNFFGGVFGAIGTAVGNLLGTLGEFFGNVFGLVGGAIGDFFSRTGAAIQLGLNTVKQTFQNAINTVLNLFRDLYEHNHYVRDMVRGIQIEINSVRTFLTNAITAIKNWLLGQWQAIQQGAQTAWALVQQRIITPVQQAWATIVRVFGQIAGWFGDRFNEVAAKAHEGWNKFLGIITGLKNAVTSTIHDHIVQPIIDKISSLGPAMLKQGQNIISNLINGIIGGLKSFANMNMAGAGKVLSFLGFDQATINALPHFASGGTMAHSGLALVGENGPEVVQLPGGARVTPAAAGAGMGISGGGPLIIQLQVDGRRLAEVTVPHLHTVIRNATGTRRF